MTTTNLHRTRRDRVRTWLGQRDPIAFLSMIVLLLIIAGSLLRSRFGTGTTIAAVPTPQLPIILIATAPAVVPPTTVPIQLAAVLPNTLRHPTVAYDAPAGNVLGAIEQGRAYQVLARYGADWLQADVSGSGVVWLRSADVLDLPADLADLQPQEAPQVVYQVVNAPAPVVEQRADAAPTPASPTPELAQYQSLAVPADEEPLSPALLREAQDR